MCPEAVSGYFVSGYFVSEGVSCPGRLVWVGVTVRWLRRRVGRGCRWVLGARRRSGRLLRTWLRLPSSGRCAWWLLLWAKLFLPKGRLAGAMKVDVGLRWGLSMPDRQAARRGRCAPRQARSGEPGRQVMRGGPLVSA